MRDQSVPQHKCGYHDPGKMVESKNHHDKESISQMNISRMPREQTSKNSESWRLQLSGQGLQEGLSCDYGRGRHQILHIVFLLIRCLSIITISIMSNCGDNQCQIKKKWRKICNLLRKKPKSCHLCHGAAANKHHHHHL